ncbi:hypothetical protein CJA_1355 [Cellvibrio japonicus Ueda107]|uniref:Uncharacterized protein n=1 Tax=Cellvibrio japonicus (strain Ueda107) TaxID=498211 RepID=B3PCZ2_CELJU|nr:hypothetical protein CJA_1355 [Cellvibrio japonicus Ueda107]
MTNSPDRCRSLIGLKNGSMTAVFFAWDLILGCLWKMLAMQVMFPGLPGYDAGLVK